MPMKSYGAVEVSKHLFVSGNWNKYGQVWIGPAQSRLKGSSWMIASLGKGDKNFGLRHMDSLLLSPREA
jgi:hypothetical protein